MPDRELRDISPGGAALDDHVQELVESERGLGEQGVLRTWLCSDSPKKVLISDATGVTISRDNGTTAPTHVINDGTPAGGHLAGTYPDPGLSAAIIDFLVPAGTIWGHGGVVAPSGWLLCNGASLVAASYPKLFAAIGTIYGGAGATFNLPDLRGRMPLGASASHGIGTAGGSETAPGPAHTHPGSHTHGPGSHTHLPGSHTHTPGSHTHTPGSHTHGLGAHVHAQSTHTHGLGGHVHSSAGHQHGIDHDHGNAVGAAAASASALNGRFTAGGANALPDTHTHPVDLPSLGATLSTSTTPPDTGGPTAGAVDTGGPTAANTGPPSASASTDTTGPSALSTGTPSADATGTPSAVATGTPSADATAGDSTAHAASYPGTVPILPPFLSVSYIIRAG